LAWRKKESQKWSFKNLLANSQVVLAILPFSLLILINLGPLRYLKERVVLKEILNYDKKLESTPYWSPKE
jgi:hypothetical protein